MSYIKQRIIGDTIRLTWVSSGAVADQIGVTAYDSDESMVGSMSMSSSGNGHYYADYTLDNTPGYNVFQTTAWVSSYPYINRTKINKVLEEV